MPTKQDIKPTPKKYTICGVDVFTSLDNIDLNTTFNAEQYAFLVAYKKKLGLSKEQDVIRIAVEFFKNKFTE